MEMKIEIPNIKEYINHLDKPDKFNIQDWEIKRKEIHDKMFKDLGVERSSRMGQKISREIDKICSQKLDDGFQKDLKLISSAKTEEDLFKARLKIKNRQYADRIRRATNKDANKLDIMQELAENGGSHEVDSIISPMRKICKESGNNCRICGRDLSVEYPRVNDLCVGDIGELKQPNSPICGDCSKDKPDEYHIKFKEIYWKKKDGAR